MIQLLILILSLSLASSALNRSDFLKTVQLSQIVHLTEEGIEYWMDFYGLYLLPYDQPYRTYLIGYDDNKLYIVFPGSRTVSDYINNLGNLQTYQKTILNRSNQQLESISLTYKDKYETFFTEKFSNNPNFTNTIKNILENDQENKITVYTTGFSMGGVMSQLCVFWLLGQQFKQKIVNYSYGSPRLGNNHYQKAVQHIQQAGNDVEIYRIYQDNDPISAFPDPPFVHAGEAWRFDPEQKALFPQAYEDDGKKWSVCNIYNNSKVHQNLLNNLQTVEHFKKNSVEENLKQMLEEQCFMEDTEVGDADLTQYLDQADFDSLQLETLTSNLNKKKRIKRLRMKKKSKKKITQKHQKLFSKKQH